ncbi:zinc finger protein 704-like [Clytia hemisphaerica]|uniref:C2H2-type domain-containing protein n=1 Tax=Clytia hemisphaerica TaxID=252671 RepID=A0A7M5UXX5_9CNID|eukprot:TCONS_00009915-protein
MYTKPHNELDWTQTGKSSLLKDPVYKDELSLRLESYNSKMRNSLIQHPVISPTSTFRTDISGPVGHTETIPRLVITSPTKPIPVQSPIDDVRSAAIALTSLSLSPASLPSTYEEVSARHKFAFPPQNTPTEEPIIPFYATQERGGNSPRPTPPSTTPRYRNRAYSHISTNERLLEILPPKPRSYSTTRDCFKEIGYPPYERLTKQRSHSFDAVGRSHNYYKGEEHPTYYSPPSQRKISIDEGIGTSDGGSIESLEIPVSSTTKRKIKQHQRNGFRCMWRGCDKEFTTLNGIILHVRHSHIGVERAGEEEFYFDDIETQNVIMTSPPKESGHQSHHAPIIVSANQTKAFKFSEAISIPRNPEPINIPYRDQVRIPETSISGNTGETSKPVSVIQPVIAALKPMEFQFNDEVKFPYMQNSMQGLSPETKHRRRKHAVGKKKCRKVYGMSNKDLWCTQCRWKKACARFS